MTARGRAFPLHEGSCLGWLGVPCPHTQPVPHQRAAERLRSEPRGGAGVHLVHSSDARMQHIQHASVPGRVLTHTSHSADAVCATRRLFERQFCGVGRRVCRVATLYSHAGPTGLEGRRQVHCTLIVKIIRFYC
jgi:hypothetical protein